MISRFGQPIFLGWPEHHLEWIRAALTLDYKSRQFALQDIAEMTGRGIKAVRDRAKRIKEQDKRQAKIANRRVMRLPPDWSRVSSYRALGPSQIAPPAMARLMGCR